MEVPRFSLETPVFSFDTPYFHLRPQICVGESHGRPHSLVEDPHFFVRPQILVGEWRPQYSKLSLQALLFSLETPCFC